MAEELVGQRIGNLRVLRLIGQGATGSVYEAVHELIGQRFAVKVLRPEATARAEQRFLQEARAVSLIRHPGVVYVTEFGTLDSGAAYLVMELLEGESLHARLRGSPMPLRQALRLGRQLAVALAAVHQRGVIHRDLKPANIMVVPDGEVPGGERTKIVDFGIAKLRAEDQPLAGAQVRTLSHDVFGTPAYMAPEQCRGSRDISDRTDVYALGALLYELLSGSVPFWAPSPPELMYQHLHSQPLPLRELAPAVPPPVAALVHRLLAKEPAERPPMVEVADELERLAAALDAGPGLTPEAGRGAPVVTLSPGALPPARAARWRLGLTAATAAGALVLVLSGWQLRGGRSQAARPAPPPTTAPAALPTALPAALPPALASPAPPRSPPASATVAAARWELRSEPAGAAVIRLSDGAQLGETPWQVAAGAAPTAVTLRRAGYQDAAPILLPAAQPVTQTITLRGERRRARSSAAPLRNEDIQIQ